MSSSSAVNVGTLQGVLEMRDLFSAQMDKFEARLKAVEEKVATTSRKVKTDNDKISETYKKVAASLDPVVANTQKYEKAESALSAALKAGIINQEKYNASLSQAKEKYLSANASTLTWREEIQNLTGKVSGLTAVMGPLGGKISSLVSSLTLIASTAAVAGQSLLTLAGIKALLNNVVTKLIDSFKAFYDIVGAGGLAAIGSIVVALFAVYEAFKLVKSGFDLVSSAVSEGLKTQLVIDRLNKSLALNGSAAGLSARQLVEYAEALELSTTRSKEEIVAAETVLSRFDSLGKESYPRALKASLAFAKATGDTADASAKKLGPALEGNIRSLNSFREVGIVFTTAERKKMQAMVDTGNIIEYQTILFDLLERKIGTVGESTDKNLTRQMERARIVAEDFKEGIASEVIPALEDLTNELVNSLGGWEDLKKGISGIGRDIGDIIRTVIYDILIQYHKWSAATNGLVASLLTAFAGLARAAGADKIADTLTEGANRQTNAAVRHSRAVIESTLNLAKHRTALEGDAEAHNKDRDATDHNREASDKLKSAIEAVAAAIENYKQKAENARSLYLATITGGLKFYSDELQRQKVLSAIQTEENRLRAVGKHLTDEQRNAIASAIITEDQFRIATQRTLDARRQLETVTAKLAQTMTKLFAASAGGSDPAMKSLLDNLKDANQITSDTRSEEEKRAETVARANELYKLGQISAESLQKVILDNSDKWNIELTDSQVAWARISEKMKAVAEGMAYDLIGSMVEAAKRGESIWSAAGKSIKESILSAVQDAISEWLAKWFKAMAEWLVRWVATQRAAQAASASLQGPTQSGGNLSGSTTQTAATYASRYAGYAAAAYAVFVLYKAFLEDHKRKFGTLTISDGVAGFATGHGDKYIKQVQEATSQLLKSLADFTSQLSIDMNHYGTVILEASKSGFNVKFSATSSGQLFKTMEEAQEYAQVLMLKYGDFADSVSFLVQSVIKSTKAINLQQLASDIDFANTLNTQNMESIAQDMKSALDLATEQWKRAKDLWLSFYDTNLPAFAEAATSIITRLSNSLQSQYNSLMGIKEDPKTAWQRQALAYNAQRAITLTQIKLWELEIAARIANYNATRTLIGGGGGGGKGGGGGGYVGITQGFVKFVNAFVETTADVIDPAFQALLDIQKLLQDAAESIPGMIDPTKYPGTKGGHGGGGGGNRDSVRDWIDSKRYDLDTRSLDEWVKKAKDIAREYDDQIKLAGKDKKLREELLALKERELALLQKEQIDSVVESFKNFLGLVSPFDQVRKTAQDLIKQIEASPLGNDRKAKMIGRVLADLDRQIQAMSDKMASDLFGSIAGMLEDSKLKTDILRAQFILNWQLQLADAKARYATLLMEGKLSEENRKLFEDAIKTLEGIDPEKMFKPPGEEGTASGRAYTSRMEQMAKANEDYIKRMKSAQDLLKKYTDQGVDPLTRELREINTDFKTITDALGETPEIIKAKNEAIARAYEEALSGIQDAYDSLLNGPDSSLTVEKQYEAAKAEYNKLIEQVKAGDYSNLDKLAGAEQTYIDLLGQMFGTSTGGFTTERDKILAQLSDLLKLGNVNPAGGSVLQFPNPTPTTNPGIIGANIVTATNDVGKVIDMRGARHERLLERLSDKLTDIRVVIESGQQTGNNGVTLTYG